MAFLCRWSCSVVMAMAHHLPAPEKEKLIKNSPVTWLVRKQDVRLNYEVETLQWPRSTWTPPKTQTRCRWVLTQQVKPIETSALTMCVFDSLILVSDLKVLKNSSLYFCPSVHGKTKSVFTSFMFSVFLPSFCLKSENTRFSPDNKTISTAESIFYCLLK